MHMPRTQRRLARGLMASAAIGTLALLTACGQEAPTGTEEQDTSARPSEQKDIVGLNDDRSDADAAYRPNMEMEDMVAFEAAPAPPGRTASAQSYPQPLPGTVNTETFEDFDDNPVHVVVEDPVSTFSIDVDTASYGVMRSYLNDGTLPPRDAIRVEELINYFDYNYPLTDDAETPFRASTYLYGTPWNSGTQLLHIGIQGFDMEPDQRPDSNLVLLLDVSGSMNEPNKLPLLKKAMRMLVNEMGENDTIAIVVYAGAAGTVLQPTPGSDKAAIMAALDQLHAGGSTAGGEGISQAYALATLSYRDNGVNRVILATDGDFNVGINDPERLEDFVSEQRDSGIDLTVLGFGRGNYNDLLMQKLAQAGNGNAAYIDTLREARKVLVDEIGGTLFTIAKDVKIQVEFNPAEVLEYRLIGYETRALNREDFANDKVDAGDIGSGHTVTAIYEIVPAGSDARWTEPLRHQSLPPTTETTAGDEIAHVRIRYKRPDDEQSELIETAIGKDSALGNIAELPVDVRFAAAVAAFGQKLRGGTFLGDFDYRDIATLAAGAKGPDTFGYRAEFTQLLDLAETADALPELQRPTIGYTQ